MNDELSDTELLDWLQEASAGMRCVPLPGADAGRYWEVVQGYEVVGLGRTVRAAIFDATLDPWDYRRSDGDPMFPGNGG